MVDLSNYITNIHSNEEIYNAKEYMINYKKLIDDYNLDIGIIGRFFEKLFGTNKYSNAEKILYDKYKFGYSTALQILYDVHQEKYVYNPFK